MKLERVTEISHDSMMGRFRSTQRCEGDVAALRKLNDRDLVWMIADIPVDQVGGIFTPQGNALRTVYQQRGTEGGVYNGSPLFVVEKLVPAGSMGVITQYELFVDPKPYLSLLNGAEKPDMVPMIYPRRE